MDSRAALRDIVASQPEANLPRACKICGGEATLLASLDFGKGGGGTHSTPFPLGKYDVDIPYYDCSACGFIFTPTFDSFSPEEWTRFIYNEDYGNVDRNYQMVRPAENAALLESYLRAMGPGKACLDFGGGNGLTASLMRDRGWAYDSIDPFGGQDHVSTTRAYDFCSSFEVFEHVPNPLASFEDLLSRCSRSKLLVLVGTKLSDGLVTPGDGLEWWYAAPRNGHISLYSRRSMAILASKHELSYFSMNRDLHFFSRNFSRVEVMKIIFEGKLRRTLKDRPRTKLSEAA